MYDFINIMILMFLSELYSFSNKNIMNIRILENANILIQKIMKYSTR